MSTTLQLLDRLADATAKLHDATQAIICLARVEQTHATARALDDDDFVRLPSKGARCAVSQWSRTTLWRRIQSGTVLSKTVGGCRFYSLTSVRKILSETP